ncbi:glycosyltransferase [Stenomitos frigidus]|uniref:STAS domain-containing protein n=1 Tax=Stenomitos frigidus ULC18 TaxID=2107698 RepID=A0A2T1ED17_9CYAN|nr:glycosyltransferase [Stenomitos frigidus]PSB30601.1 hypothetical protein C7B82_08640 [Stenomitos frigidus ULC18]
MILVTVGTEQYPFNRLMNWLDLLIRDGVISKDERLIIQYGSSTKIPFRSEAFERLPEPEFKSLLEQARVVISHCGEGSVILLESLNKPYLLVPRARRFGEHVDDHQLEMAEFLKKQGIPIAECPGDIARFLSEPRSSGIKLNHSEDELCQVLANDYDFNQHTKAMLICSSGGHFKYAQGLRPLLDKFQKVCWVTFMTGTTKAQLSNSGESIHWAYSPTNRNLLNLIRNLALAVRVLKQEQPDIVISTGAGVAVPFLLLAKFIYRKETIFIESKTRVSDLSLSAKLLYYASGFSKLIVRNQAIESLYPKTKYIGIASADKIIDIRKVFTSRADRENTTLTKVNGIAIIKAPDYLGLDEIDRFNYTFQSVSELYPKKIVIDLSSTTSIDIVGIEALKKSLAISKAAKIKLALWSVNQTVQSALSKSNLKKSFAIETESLATTIVRNKVNSHGRFQLARAR